MRVSAIFCAVAVSLSALTGCATNLGGDSANGGAAHDSSMHMGHGDGNAEFSDADVMFAQMMIPHHQQAVDMGTLAETRASNPEVRALAAKIKAEQAPEVAQMKAWLEDAGASMTMGHDMGNGAGMDGMLDSAALAKLGDSTGAAFDQLYLQGMIGHHAGAIDMAKTVLDSKNAEVKKLAESIVASQAQQISYMQTLL